jgi:soluble cytochrome b562
MEEMNGVFRKLRRQVDDKATNASSIALAANLHQLAQRVVKSTPRLVARAPEKDRAALLASYREQMQELIATIDDLQAALKAGKNAKAVEIVEDLRDLEKAGHHKFRAEDSH